MDLKDWKPLEGIDGNFFLEGLYDDYEGIRLLLRCMKNDKVFRIFFDAVLSYRNTDEGSLLKSLQNGTIKGVLFTTHNSLFLDWYYQESFASRDSRIIHYCIYTPNDCIDVIASFAPKVEWLT